MSQQHIISYNDIKSLNDICELKIGRNIDKKYQRNKGVPYIVGASNIQKGVIKTNVFLDPSELKNLSYAYKGDIIISCVGTLGKIGILRDEKAVLSRHVFALSPIYPIDELYLIALVSYALADCVPETEGNNTGFSNKLEPELLLNQEIQIADNDDQRWLVLSLVRYAIIQVATHIDHITPTDISKAIEMLTVLQMNTKKRIRNQLKHIDELEKMLGDCPAALEEDEVEENPFRLLFEERKRMNKLLNIL